MKLIIENWRKFVKETAGDMDNDGNVDSHDVAKLAAQVADDPSAGETQTEEWLSFAETVMQTIVRQNHGTSIEDDVDYAIFQAGESMELEDSREAKQWLTQNRDKVMELHPNFDSSTKTQSDRENYNLASSVMQNDDNISLSKKIPSGLG